MAEANVRFHLFGPVELRTAESVVAPSILAQPKRTALLAFLAAARPGTLHRRATLLALLWPELDEGHARNALSKSLHLLRQSLGEAVIVTRGPDEVGTSPDHLWCDVAAFHAAVEAGDHEAGLALHGRGLLLEGFSLPDAPPFEEWLDRERDALLRKAVGAANALATAAEREGDFVATARWARAAAGLARYDEPALRRLLTALDRIGDRAGAVAAYNEFADRLAKELELEPSPETRALADGLRARSGTAMAPGEPVVPGRPPAGIVAPATQPQRASIGPPAGPAGTGVAAEPRPAVPAGGRWPRRLTLVALVAAASLSLLAILSTLLRPAVRPVARFDVTPAAGQGLVPNLPGVEFDLSPDGTRLVYAGEAPDGVTQLWLRQLGDRSATPVAGTSGAVSPVFSPDGQTIAFDQGGTIRTLSLRGGSSVALAVGREPGWSPDGEWIYFSEGFEPGSVIRRVRARGGRPEAVTRPTEDAHGHPMPLPGGRGLLLTTRPAGGQPGAIAVADISRGEVRELHAGATARYAASGHIVWALPEGSLLAAPFDVRRMRMTRPPVGLPEAVRYKVGGTAMFTLSRTGAFLYQVGGRRVQELVWVSRAGGVEPVDPEWRGTFSSPALSPDGSLLSVTLLGSRSADIWVKRLDAGPQLRLTLDGRQNTPSAWTPDGRSITFGSDREGPFRMWTKRADGTGEAVPNLPPGLDGNRGRWSPDGQWLIYRPGFMDGDILAIRPGRDTVPVPLVATAARERNPALSPDGRWLAHTSDETGRDEVYVVPFPDTGAGRWMVSTTGGLEPVWARSGRELFYRTSRGEMVAVAVETDPMFSPGRARVLFTDASLHASPLHPQYDVAPDGQRFLMIRRLRSEPADRLILLQNFFDELRRTVR